MYVTQTLEICADLCYNKYVKSYFVDNVQLDTI